MCNSMSNDHFRYYVTIEVETSLSIEDQLHLTKTMHVMFAVLLKMSILT